MSDHTSNRSPQKSLLRMIAMPVQFVLGGFRETLNSLKEIGRMFEAIFTRGRRNENFEKAGRESEKVVRRHVSVSAFRKGERERTREVMEAERESRTLLNSNSKKAVEYREDLTQRKVEYSRGAAVNHLAMVNERHRKAEAAKAEQASESPDKKLPK